MSAKTILLKSVCRETASGEADSLEFRPGVNVIVGLKDTGKSGWLQTISYLLGDTDPPDKAMRPELAEKYDSATLQMLVGEEEVTLQRRWKEQGAKHKVFVNGEGISSADFSDYIQKKLGIPIVYYPKGSPYSGETWPQLSWRMLFRHIYREERFWSDLADKQPEKQQHACVLQFLGAADKLYPKELGQQINERQQLLTLQARKEQFDSVLQEAAKDIIPDPAISTAPTPDSIDQGVARLRQEAEELRQRREAVLAETLAAQARQQPQLPDTALAERRVRLSVERQAVDGEFAKVEQRLRELTDYRGSVRAELNRLKRVETAGDLFAALKVTRCPVCDQPVQPGSSPPGKCYLCHQSVAGPKPEDHAGAMKRLAFEIEQLEGEEAELTELLDRLQQERLQLQGRLRRQDEELAEVETLLRPVRAAFAAILPPEISVIDTKIGQFEERVAQLLRLRRAFEQRDQLSAEIDRLRAKVQTLGSDVEAKGSTIPFEQLSDVMSDGINDYLNVLKAGDPLRWPHPGIRFEINKYEIKLLVGKSSWTNLGATSIGYVVLGYHYSLLKLSRQDGYNYPGLALIDFPMTLADKTTIADKENYLIEPFVDLFNAKKSFQLIVCGRAFENLSGVHRLQLTTVWRQQPPDQPPPRAEPRSLFPDEE
jgi:hypothetical protein